MRVRLPVVLLLLTFSLPVAAVDRVQLTLDTSEADQVLAILALRNQGRPVADSEWQKLFATAPYQRLKQREKAIGERFHDPTVAFTDEDFKRFVLSADLLPRAAALSSTLDRWKKADLREDATRVLAYLPADATLRAKAYPTIKPGINSFVWDLSSDPTIFLYLDPEVSREKFENNVTHELHHIGLGSVGPIYDGKIAALSEPAHTAADWMGSFGEGFAMLAAAGGPDVDPHAASSPQEHARWEQDMGEFNDDLHAVNQFFLDILNAKFASSDAIGEKAGSFFGVQGPWYTVGYKMSVMVEKRFGRPALIGTMLDPRCLLVLYNRAAAEQNAAGKPPLPLWSADVLSAVHAGSCESQ
ncbi:MAG: DUF5700 domain-containing putative Zn-dependent protease [Terriglobales bacterium]|jgi:hypothetical protein